MEQRYRIDFDTRVIYDGIGCRPATDTEVFLYQYADHWQAEAGRWKTMYQDVNELALQGKLEVERLRSEVEWYSNLMKKGNDELEAMIRKEFVARETAKSMTALAEKYKGRKCNNCKNYRREGNTTIRGCEYKPDRKSPKKWFCADWKSLQEASND